MPNYVGNSPWTDAANYGGGAGQALGQALFAMPLQRQQLAAQNAQMMQQQQMERAKFIAQQQHNDQMFGLGESRFEEQKRAHELQIQAAERTAKANELRADYQKQLLDLTKQKHNYFGPKENPLGWIEVQPDGSLKKNYFPVDTNQSSGSNGPAMTGGQAAADVLGRVRQYAAALGSVGSTDPNRPDISKLDPQLLGMLSNRVYQAASPQLGMRPMPPTNTAPVVGVPPMLNATNAAPVMPPFKIIQIGQ